MFVVVGGLQQQARADALGLDGVAAVVPVGCAARGQSDLHQAHIDLGLEDFQGFGAEIGGHQHFDELLGHGFGSGLVHGTVEGDDAAEGAGGVGLEGLGVGFEGARTHGHAAGVGVLDDHAGRGVKALDAFPGRIGVGDIVVAQFLALQLHARGQRAGCGVQVAVPGSLLVAVFTVAQILDLDELAVALAGEQITCRHVFFAELLVFEPDRGQVVADGAVVLADAVECRHGQRKAQLVGQFAGSLQARPARPRTGRRQ